MQNQFSSPSKTFNREIKGKFIIHSFHRNIFTKINVFQDSWQHLLRDRATRSLTYNDEQFHALEKIKVCLES